ncbi:MAG: FtsX-like permease family protein [Acidimicrobiia bacterium]
MIIDPSQVSDEFAAEISEAQIVIRVDPNRGDVEALRTAVVAQFPTAQVRSVAEVEYDQGASARELRLLATVGLGIVLGIATFSLSIGTASRLLQRRDAFAFLRAGGLLPSQIRRLVALESTVPLAVFTAFSALLGVAAGAAVATSAGTQPEVPWSTIGVASGRRSSAGSSGWRRDTGR